MSYMGSFPSSPFKISKALGYKPYGISAKSEKGKTQNISSSFSVILFSFCSKKSLLENEYKKLFLCIFAALLLNLLYAQPIYILFMVQNTIENRKTKRNRFLLCKM